MHTTDSKQPTPGAMRAASQLFPGFSAKYRNEDSEQLNMVAAIIDRETGSRELLSLLKIALPYVESCEETVNGEPGPANKDAQAIRAAIARAEGRE